MLSTLTLFVREDGVLGSDIVQDAVLILDFPNQRVDIELAGATAIPRAAGSPETNRRW
ncbi:MAG: hypothetical protein AAGD06_30255 [Acidobacteriota bacterium]